jgi:hypothetical protein
MSGQSISVLSLSVIATAALTKYRAVTAAGAHAAADIYGVTKTDGAIGDCVAVDVIGTTTIEAGAAIPADTKYVIADAQGRAIPATGTPTPGTSLGKLVPGQSAGAAGDLVEVLFLGNV